MPSPHTSLGNDGFHLKSLCVLCVFSGFLFDWNSHSGWSQDKCNNWRSGNTIEGPAPPQYVSSSFQSLCTLCFQLCVYVHVCA